MIGYSIELIPNRSAQEMVVNYHYLHRRAQAMFSYGLFDGFTMIGCVIYGKPASPAVCVGICGAEESSKVLELTRLWVLDGTPKNTESFLIGNSLKLLPKDFDIIVSYAEVAAGHVGVIYQATNWIYTGLTDQHTDWQVDGKSSKHYRHLFDQYGGVEGAKSFFGDRLQKIQRGRKHRYVMFRGNKKRKTELLQKLRYTVSSYPKQI